MKKQYALPALLALLFLMLFSAAFADTVTIGTGTSTTNYFPFYGLYGYSYSQQIYTQAQINASGNITKIRFYNVSGAIANSKDWVIYMGHTDKETFATTTDWVPLANLTQVFAGDVTNLLPAANNWMEITLQTPFNYNNIDNLVIAVDENTPGYGSMSWGGFTSGTNTGICYYNDSTNPDPASPPSANYRSGIINRIQLVFPNTTAPLAPVLTEPANGGWALTDTILKWQPTPGAGDANAYDVYFGTSANPPLVSSDQAANYYTPTLTANQKYYWKVVAKNEIGDSPASDIFSFNTPGANNLVESFEETTFPPPGWANPGTWSRSTSYKVHGAASAYKYGSASAQYILSTPKLTITNDSALNFWSYVGTATGTLQVVYSQDRETWTQVGSDITHAAASTWYNNNVDLSSLAGNSYYLGIRTGLQGSSYYIDMVIGPEITPVTPDAPILSSPADGATFVDTSASLNWQAAFGAAGYKLYFDTSNPPTSYTDIGNVTTYSPTMNDDTTYYWQVVSYNSTGDASNCPIWSFTTSPAGIVQIGEGSSNQYMPVNTYWGYSYSQSIYRQEDIDMADQRIEKISYYWNGVGAAPNSNEWVVYMGHTDEETFASTSDWIALDDLTEVYAGTLNIPATAGWITITLNNPFVYNNSQNLVIAVDENKQGYDSSSYFFFNTLTTGENRSLRCQNDNINPNPASPPSGTLTAAFPNILMQFGDLPANPIFSYNPVELDFGTLMQDNPSAWQNVTVTNTGAGTINLSASNISIIGSDATMFEFDEVNLPAALAPGISVDIPVRATLTDEGAISATLRMVYSGVNYDVVLSAVGLPDGTYIIGDGTATSRYPLGSYFGFERSAALYTATELGEGNKRINTLGWYATDEINITVPTKIYLKAHEEDTVAVDTWANLIQSATPVFEGTGATIDADDWHLITLDNSFDLDSGDNLLVLVERNHGGSGGGTGGTAPAIRATTISNMHQMVQADNNPPTGNTSVQSTRPNLMFFATSYTITTPPNDAIVVSPADEATEVKLDTTLNWANGGGAPTGYKLYFGDSTPPAYIGDMGEDLSYEPTLAYETTYYWKVVPYNAHGDNTTAPIWSFTTVDDPTVYSFPWTENFDSVTAPAIPNGWTIIDANDDARTWVTYAGDAHTSPNSMRVMYHGSNATDDYAISPALSLTGGVSYQLEFYYRAYSASYTEKLKVMLGTAPTVDAMTTTVIDLGGFSNTTYQRAKVIFTPPSTDMYYLGWHGYSAANQYYIYFDTVTISEAVDYDLAAIGITGDIFGFEGEEITHTITVENKGAQDVDGYTVYLKNAANDAILAQETITTTLAVDASNSVPLQWTPQNAGDMQIYGEVYFAADETAANNITDPMDVKIYASDLMVESFEGTTFPPEGWVRTTSSTTYWSSSSSYAVHGSKSMYAYTSSTTDYRISTPMLQVDTDSTLDFYVRAGNISQVLQIEQSTDRENWQQVGDDITFAEANVWYPISIPLSELSSGNYYLAFYAPTHTTTGNLYVDLVVTPQAAAVAPGPVTLVSPADEAENVPVKPTLSWTAPTTGGLADAYKVYLGTSDTFTQNDLVATVETLNYTLETNLNYNTQYYWTVAASNDTGDSTNNPVFSFTTVEDPTITVFPFTEGFEDGYTHAQVIADKWMQLTGPDYTAKSWTANNTLTDYNRTPRTGDWNAYLQWSGQSALVRPIYLQSGYDYSLEFYARQNTAVAANATMTALLGSQPTLEGLDRVIIPETGLVDGDYQRFFAQFTVSTNGVYYIGIQGWINSTPWYISLDDITITETVAVPAEPPILTYPVELSNLPKEGFDFTWTPNETGGAPEFYILYIWDDEDFGLGDMAWETESTSFNPVLDEGQPMEFVYGRRYNWAVSSYKMDEESDLAESWFAIEDDPRILSLPRAENFDDVSTPNFPSGWTPIKTNTSSTLTTSSTYSHTPSNSVYMYSYTTTETMRLVTPEVVVPMNSIKLSFQLRAGSTTNYSLKVGTVDTPDLDGVFTEIATITPTVSAAFEPHSVSFANYAGTDRYIAFQHGVGGTYQSFYLDTVLFEELMPTDLAATTLSGPSHGTAGTPFTFEVGVYNNGTQPVSNYSIHLKSDNTVLASKLITEALAVDDSAIHEIEWTPTLGGNYQVYAEVAATGDGNSSNNSTGIKNVLVFDSSMTMLPVGDDDSTLSSNSLPLNFWYKTSLSEALYYPEDLRLISGDITAIILKNDFLSSNVLNKEIKIYMAETEAEDLSAGWLTDDFVEVFSGNVDFPAGVNQIAIPLTTPFEYNGGTLAVRYFRPTDTQYHASTDRFFYTSTPDYPNRSRYIQSDTVEYDPEAPTAGGTLVAWLPNTTFVVQDAQLQPHAMLEGYVRDAANNPIPEATVTLTDERYSTITDGNGYYSFTFWEAHSVSATASKPTYYPQTITDIELLVNQPVSQDFTLQPMPRVTVSGIVNTNDIPGGVVGAKITLHGEEDHTVYSTANGAFSIPNVLGNTTGIPYTISVSYEGYDSYSGDTTVYGVPVNLGTITLIEKLWSAYNLVAEHHINGAELTWDPAEEPDYFFWDFEEDDGGWEPSADWGNQIGDWEWTNTYDVTNFVDNYGSSSVTPPPTAYSGTGFWGTIINSNHTNANGFSYLTQTFDFSGFTGTQLRFMSWENSFGEYDYCQVAVNGNLVWGPSWDYSGTQWRERVINLSAYDGMSNVEVQFQFYATASVNYAGWYIDDVYIGPPPSDEEAKFAQGRSLQDYSVYRMLAEDEESPENWTLLQSGVTDTNYLDTGFASVPSGKYKWAVRANYSGEHQSPAVISNPLGVFGIPQNLVPSVLGNNVTINWTAEPGASYYVVYGSDDPYGSNWDVVGYTSTASFTFNATNVPYKFFKVSAADGDMPSGRSK